MAKDILDIAEDVKTIRRALLIGLECFGEVERIIDRHTTLSMLFEKPDPKLLPMHPTGAPDTIGDFAAALRTLETWEPQE